MKKIGILLLALTLLLCGCAEENSWPGYDGNMEGYTYCHAEGRDRQWEEDFLYLAETCLTTHPYLMENVCWTYTYREPFSEAKTAWSRDIFRKETRDRFLERVNALIPQIPDWSDDKLAWEVRGLIASLGDIHSTMHPAVEDERVLPLGFVPIAGESGYSLYAVSVPKTHESAYLGRLTAINGIPVETIVEALTAYVSAENAYYPIHAIAGIRSPGLLCVRSALCAVGVVEADAASARFSFETDGGIVECAVEAVKPEEYGKLELQTHPMYTSGGGIFRKNDNYWYEWLEEDTLYLRLASLREEADCSFLRYVTEAAGELQKANFPVRLILDFRCNTGGPPYITQWQYLVDAIRNCETDGVYILTNGSCISSGVAAPYQLAQAIPAARLVGSPTAQFPNGAAGQQTYALPHSGLTFSLSRSYSCFAPGKTDSALHPHMPVEQTWEDYVNSRDTVLDYVLNLP